MSNRFSRIDLLKKFSDDRFARFDEAEEFVIVAVLMTATDPQRKRLVFNRNSPTPVFRIDFTRFNALPRQLLPKIFSKALAPKAGIDLLLFPFIGREFGGAELKLGFHQITNALRCSSLRIGGGKEFSRTSTTLLRSIYQSAVSWSRRRNKNVPQRSYQSSVSL